MELTDALDINNASNLFAKELVNLLVNDKIKASYQTNISPKAYQTLQTTKMNFDKTVGLTSFQKPPLQSASSLQVSPSMSTFISFFYFSVIINTCF